MTIVSSGVLLLLVEAGESDAQLKQELITIGASSPAGGRNLSDRVIPPCSRVNMSPRFDVYLTVTVAVRLSF